MDERISLLSKAKRLTGPESSTVLETNGYPCLGDQAGSLRLGLERTYLASQLLKRLPLRLRNQQRRKDTAQHEQRKDLQHVVQPRRLGLLRRTPGPQRSDEHLGDDGAHLTAGGADAVGRAAVAGREALAGDDEGRGVGSEVEEEHAEDVEADEAGGADYVVAEAWGDDVSEGSGVGWWVGDATYP